MRFRNTDYTPPFEASQSRYPLTPQVRKSHEKTADISIIYSHFFKGWKLIFILLFIFSNYTKFGISIHKAMSLSSSGFETNNQAAWWVLAKWLKHSSKHSNGTAGLASDGSEKLMYLETPKQCLNCLNELLRSIKTKFTFYNPVEIKRFEILWFVWKWNKTTNVGISRSL